MRPILWNFLVLGAALFLRIFYVDGRLPKYSIWIVIPWVSIGVLNGIFHQGIVSEKLEVGLFYFLSVSFSAMLGFHVISRMLNSPMRKWPGIRQVWLIFKRSLIILPKKYDQMIFWAKQRLVARDRTRNPAKNKFIYTISSRGQSGLEIGVGILSELDELVRGFSSG